MEKNLHENVVQRELKPMNGMLILILVSLGLLASIALVIGGGICLDNYMGVIGAILLIAGVLGIIAFPILYAGLRVVGPNEALVLTLFGNYYGTILKQGFYFVNPFSVYNNPAYQNAVAEAKQAAAEAAAGGKKQNGGTVKVNAKKTVSLKNITLNNGVQKVNDVMGNPIVIGAVVIWRVVDPTKAVFNVEDYTEFLSIQTDSTIRNIARMYPYDIMDTDGDGIQDEKSLRGSAQEIAETMKNELNKKVEFAGLMIEEVRITHLAYSEEIAAAMLKRQQAEAVIAARAKIVEGAVGMVKMAIDKLGEEEVVYLDEERKAAMVSNLMVVLCSDKDTQPIVNSGSIY
ncbi:MAG: SPFH domain-containing protein [Firmicutes bacterium]|nr:SPFH domain-containing protein [Bacillota bacterium]